MLKIYPNQYQYSDIYVVIVWMGMWTLEHPKKSKSNFKRELEFSL